MPYDSNPTGHMRPGPPQCLLLSSLPCWLLPVVEPDWAGLPCKAEEKHHQIQARLQEPDGRAILHSHMKIQHLRHHERSGSTAPALFHRLFLPQPESPCPTTASYAWGLFSTREPLPIAKRSPPCPHPIMQPKPPFSTWWPCKCTTLRSWPHALVMQEARVFSLISRGDVRFEKLQTSQSATNHRG